MHLNRLLLALALLAVSAALACAGDIVAMPTGNSIPQGQFQLNYIYWDREAVNPPGVRDYVHIGELFVGVTDRLEIDYLHVVPQGWDKVAGHSFVHEFNVYYTVLKESAETPSLIVGVTNLFGQDWLPSRGRPSPDSGDNRVSPFVVGSYNVRTPTLGPPSPEDPLVRLHLGYGTGFHESKLFGGAQVALDPQWGFGVFNYQEDPAYLAAYMPTPQWELNAGWAKGDPVYHISYMHPF